MEQKKTSIQLKISCMLVGAYLCAAFYHQCSSSLKQETVSDLTEEKIIFLNDSCYEATLDDIMAAIALVEGFHKTPYFCGVKWTIGYGSTILEDGSSVKENTPTISCEQAKNIVYNHLNKHVKPFILNYVYRPLNSDEMRTTCLFIYNIGGKNFSGYDEDGNECGEPSNYLRALNQNLPPEECARYLTGFRSSNGKQANGLLKRRWVEGAIYLGILTPEIVLMLQPERFYGDTISFYYKQQNDDYWDYDYSEETIQEFLEKNISEKNNVQSIL